MSSWESISCRLFLKADAMTEMVLNDDGWQCGMYYLGRGGGRCARGGGRTERHHVVRRSEDEPICGRCGGSGVGDPAAARPCADCSGSGKLPRPTEHICRECHDQIHRKSEPWLYPVDLPSGEIVHVEAANKRALSGVLAKADGLSDLDTIALLMSRAWPEELWDDPAEPRYWRVTRCWSVCGQKVEEAGTELMEEAEIGARRRREGAWRIARAAHRLEVLGDGWRLFDIQSKAEFAAELGIAGRTLNAYLAAERTLHDNPAINEEKRAALRGRSIELMVSARKQIADMTGEQVQKVIDVAETSPVKTAIEYAKTIAGANESRARGYKHADVALAARAVTFKLQVPYLEGEDPVAKAQKRIQFKDEVFVVDWASDGQQSWEEVKD